MPAESSSPANDEQILQLVKSFGANVALTLGVSGCLPEVKEGLPWLQLTPLLGCEESAFPQARRDKSLVACQTPNVSLCGVLQVVDSRSNQFRDICWSFSNSLGFLLAGVEMRSHDSHWKGVRLDTDLVGPLVGFLDVLGVIC